MTELVIETREIAKESSETLTVAQNFKITAPAQYEDAGEKLKAIKALSKRIDDTLDPHIKRAFEAHRALVGEKKSHQTPLQIAEALIKRALLGYQLAEEQKRRELEAKAQEAARKERVKLEERARKAEESGKAEKAEVLQAAAAAVVAPTIASTTPKVAGISTRTSYRAEVVDKVALVEAVAGGRRRIHAYREGPDRRVAARLSLNALDANTMFLNQQARAMKETLAYPGVRVVQGTGLASRSA